MEILPDARPVHSLQSMLRTLSFYHPALPRLIPNGVFGEPTLEAVMTFQREFGLPVNGIVDNATWDAIVTAYTAAALRMSRPLAVSNLGGWQDSIAPGQSSVYLHLAQGLFQALSTVLEEVLPCGGDGTNSASCAQNIRWLQQVGNLRNTGIFGKEEWDLLTRVYGAFILRPQEKRS